MYTFDCIFRGDTQIINYYQTALSKWKEMLADSKNNNVEKLAKRISSEQIPFFESKCGGKDIGQEVMAFAGLGQFYSASAGIEENLEKAKFVYDAIEKSSCSIEVKHYAKKAAKLFHIIND